ncbi:MAG: integrase/recombinase XerD [Thermoproteota archaeon]|nr:integrase/recombinase XerD [Thermoproteota archaeon]
MAKAFVGSSPTLCTSGLNPLHYGKNRENVINFLIYLNSRGLRESTIAGYIRVLKHLTKFVDLDNPEQVKSFIASKTVMDSRKEKIVNNYSMYLKWRGLSWERPIYRRDTTLPYIPLEKEVDQLIGASNGKTATFLQFLKDSACRPIEAWRTKWIDIDLERNLVYINSPAKHSNPRAFKPSIQLIGMIQRLRKTSDYIFREHNDSRLEDFVRMFYYIRKKTVNKLQNPRLMKINFKTLRHFKATMEYHRTKDILYVKELLGHKDIKNTLVYTHLVNWENDDYTVKVASTLEECTQLLESGFAYILDYQDKKIFKKRK